MLKKRIKQTIKQSVIAHQVAKESFNESRMVMENIPASCRKSLTDEEKVKIQKQWNRVIPESLRGRFQYSLSEWEFFKAMRGDSTLYLGHSLYLPLVAHLLNNYHYTKMFEHKCLLGGDVRSDIKLPAAYVRYIDGEFYNAQMNQQTYEESLHILQEQTEFILKDAVDSSGGVGVEKLVRGNRDTNEWRHIIEMAMQHHKRDFIAQECVHQDGNMSKFNPTSVNTFRITTLYLNGIFSVLNIVLRVGKAGMKVDNWGSGGVIIGVQEDGQVAGEGYDIKLNRFERVGDVILCNEKIRQIPSIIEQIKKCHETRFSLCKLIGWDVCIDADGETVLLEVNSSQPGIIGEQLCCGPIFGNRTDEVVEYCQHRNFVYHRGLFLY